MAASAPLASQAPSETKLDGRLHQTWRHCTDDLAKRGIVDVAINGIRPEELRMVEGVERFKAEFQAFRFGKRGVLQQRDVPIVHAGSVEETSRCVPRRAERWQAEQRSIKVGLPVSGIVIDLQWPGRDIEIREPISVYAVVEASDQRRVVRID